MALLLVMGLPAAGKSSLCRQVAADCRPSAYFSFDEFVGKRLPDHGARKDFEGKVRLHLERSSDEWSLVVIDDNFYLKSMRRPFERMARAFGFEFVVAVVPCTMEEALLRNGKRKEGERVAEETIRMMRREMEFSEECQDVTDYASLIVALKNTRRLPLPPPRSVAPPVQSTSVVEQNECLLRKCVEKLVKEGLDGKRLSKVKKVVWENLRSKSGADGVTLDEVERCLLKYY